MHTMSTSSDEFDTLSVPVHPRVGVRRALATDFEAISALIQQHLDGPVASPATVQRVLTINPNSIMLMETKAGVQGVWGMLMLRPEGLEALLSGEFDALDPSSRHIAACAEAPAAIYVWMLICPGIAAEGICHLADFLRKPLYRHCNLYSRPTTKAGVAINLRRGFLPVGDPALGLLRYVRVANRQTPQRSAA